MAVSDAPIGFLASHTSPETTFFPKLLTTLLKCILDEWQKIARKKVCHNPVSNPQPQDVSDMPPTEIPGQDKCIDGLLQYYPKCLYKVQALRIVLHSTND